MALRRGFFATRADLVTGLLAFEADARVSYVQAGRFDSKTPLRAASALELQIGLAPTGDMARENRYLVLTAGADPRPRSVPQRSGETAFAMDQSLNPDSVVCCFGGIHTDGVLISGEISTLGESDASRAMFQSLSRILVTGFERVGSYWVGSEARRKLDAGWRLTCSVSSPVDYDLPQSPAN